MERTNRQELNAVQLNSKIQRRSNPVQEKSYIFSLCIIDFCRRIQSDKREYVLTKQLVKSGTSIGANIEEGINAPSKKDFANKLSISLKEARETHYWIRIMRDSKLAVPDECEMLL